MRRTKQFTESARGDAAFATALSKYPIAELPLSKTSEYKLLSIRDWELFIGF